MVSIIITCFESDRQYLGNAINSCLHQDVPIEIIVVDGGSRTLCTEDSILKADQYIHTRNNVKQYGAFTIGVNASTQKYILPLDADDFLYENVLGSMVRVMRNHDIVCGDMTNELGGNALVPSPVTKSSLLLHNPIFWTSLFTRDIWNKVGGLDPVFYVDYRFWVKCFLAGARFGYVDRLIYNHTVRTDSLTFREFDDVEKFNKEAIELLHEAKDNYMGV